MSKVKLIGGSKKRMEATSLKPPNTPLATIGSSDRFYSSRAYSGLADKRKELGDALGYDVANELWLSVFCDVPDFLDKIFPVDHRLIKKVLDDLSKPGGSYVKSGQYPHWAGYPYKRLVNEATLYGRFVKLAGAIAECLRRNDIPVNGLRWHIHSENTPSTRDPYLPDIKPDIIATLETDKHKPAIVPQPWSRIVVPIEVKKRTSASQGPALLQLLKYVRLIFRESPDRSFVLGAVLSFSSMAVYLADRTGVIGSTVLNIHEDPKSFIRVVAGLSMFSAERLGYDTSLTLLPTLRQYSEDTIGNPGTRSYAVEWNKEQDQHYWLLEMPKPKQGAEFGVMDDTETEKFVLYKGISMSRGGVIRGRATRVWKAWLLEEMDKPPQERRVFVVKDTWRDDERRLEGEFYKLVGPVDGIARMRSYAIVRIDDQDDTVSSRIRCGLSVIGRPRCIDMPQEDPDPATIPETSPDRDRGNITQYQVEKDYLPLHDVPEISPRGKTHSRLVMESYGWSIRYAKTLLELVGSTRDALEGYRAAYKRNVIHRDMSVENILINRWASGIKGKRGFIIDFDYAKVLDDPTLAQDPVSGTRPFVSGELLTERPYFDDELDDAQEVAPRHNFCHDLESILWILLWICLCKSGGGIRRQAVRDERHVQHKELEKIIRLLFQAEDISQLGENKTAAFLSDRLFKRYLKFIDDFYRPLQSLLLTLYGTLRDGYEAHHFDFDETMDAFQAAFDKAEEELIRNPPVLTAEQDANVRAEEARRAKGEDDWEHTPRPAVKRYVRPPLPALQPLHPMIPEDPTEPNADYNRVSDDTQSSENSRQNSPTPAGANTVNRKTLMLTSPEPAPRRAAVTTTPAANPSSSTKVTKPTAIPKPTATSRSVATTRQAASLTTTAATEAPARQSRGRSTAAAGTSRAQRRNDSRASRSTRSSDIEQGTTGTRVTDSGEATRSTGRQSSRSIGGSKRGGSRGTSETGATRRWR